MPPRDWPQRVGDVIQAIEAIRRYTDGMGFDQFATDQRTVEAVLDNFGIIGEAIGQIPVAVREEHPEIPWAAIRRTRNVVVHVYFGVDLPTIWNTIQVDLGPLSEQLQNILDSANDPEAEPD